MDRRDFLKTTGVAALAASGLAPAAEAARVADRNAAESAAEHAPPLPVPAITTSARVLRLVSPWHDDASTAGDHVRRLTRRIEVAMGGRWRIEPIGAAGSGLEAVMTGDADLYIASENDHLGFHPAFAFFAGLPAGTGLGARALQAWLASSGGQELWDGLASEFNIKSLLAGHTGAAPGLYSRAPLTSPGDLAGKRIAISGLARDVARGLGAEPVTLPASRIAAALASGEIDIAEAPDATLAARRSLAAAGHGGISEFNADGSTISLGFRASFWDGISESERVILSALAGEAYGQSLAEAAAEHIMSERVRAASPSLVAPVAPLPQELCRAIGRIAATVVAETAGHDALARRIDQSCMAFRAAGSGAASSPVA